MISDDQKRALAVRSCLAVPCSDTRKILRAASAGADMNVFDLEDSVPDEGKDEALTRLIGVLSDATADRGPAEVAVRINPVGSAWAVPELLALGRLDACVTIVVPKVQRAADLHVVDALLSSGEAEAGKLAPTRIHALIETAAGLDALSAICDATPRLSALILGYADMSDSLRRAPREQADPLLWTGVQDMMVVAARSRGLLAIDGPWMNVEDDARFRDAMGRARTAGFDGAWVIHPGQIETVNLTYSPTPEQILWARTVLDVLQRAALDGAGAVALDGHVLDEASARSARRIVCLADGVVIP